MMSLDDLFEHAPNLPGRVGYLEKKSGGKAGRFKPKMAQKWTRRFFVLTAGATRLSYYKNEECFRKGVTELGFVECRGATVFLKVIKSPDMKGRQLHRFTVRSEVRARTGQAPCHSLPAATT